MQSLWLQLASTIVGGLLVIAGGFLGRAYSTLQERQALKSAFASELRANLELLQQFDRIRQLTKFIKALEERRDWIQHFGVTPSEVRYDVIFTSTAGRIGTLRGDLPQRIVRVYYDLQLIQEILVENGKLGRGITEEPITRANIEKHRDLLNRMKRFCDEAADLINDLEKIPFLLP